MRSLRPWVRPDRERSLGLLELVVVVLIIAVLIAVAIPMFLATRIRSQDHAALTKIRYALDAEKSYYADLAKYTADTNLLTAELQSPVVFITTAPAQGSNQVKVAVGDLNTPGFSDGVTCLTAVSASGTTFVVKDISKGQNAGTWTRRTPDASCDQTVTGYTRGIG
jgi:type IV pilus assembly protein PilA